MTLMTRFYENLWQKRLGKLASLREAQLWMRREANARTELVPGDRTQVKDRAAAATGRLPPHEWAAFMLSGDWR